MAKAAHSPLTDAAYVLMSTGHQATPGRWTAVELAELLGVLPVAINVAVHRGQLVPTERQIGHPSTYSDEEVHRYLCRQPGKRGPKPKGQGI